MVLSERQYADQLLWGAYHALGAWSHFLVMIRKVGSVNHVMGFNFVPFVKKQHDAYFSFPLKFLKHAYRILVDNIFLIFLCSWGLKPTCKLKKTIWEREREHLLDGWLIILLAFNELFFSFFPGYQGIVSFWLQSIHASFGNRDTDEFSYLKVGIPKKKNLHY